jgi:rubrerythrin
VTDQLSRSQLLARGAKGGAALILAGSVAGSFARSASAATIPDADLAYARLLVGAELLALDFYTQAMAAKQFGADVTKALKRAFFNEQEHYAAVSGILTGAAQTPAAPSDFDFVYPAKTFDSKGSIVKLAVELETTFLGAYLGAVDAVQTDALKLPIARIAASEAQHLGVFTQLAGGDPIGVSFPNALSIDEVSDALDRYTS